jgi:serine/threonine protein kinase
MAAQLVVTLGPDQGRCFPLESGATLQVGRSLTTDTRLTDATVSRLHCEIKNDGEKTVLINHSIHGTWVNRQRVDRCDLQAGDLVRLGATELRYEVLASANKSTFPAPEEESAEGKYPFLAPPVEAGELGQLANYRVLKLLGEGGMGLVFLAEDIYLQRMVALKVLKPDLAQDLNQRRRFLREARLMAALRHDNIVTVYQVDQARDLPFMAMEYLEGEPLEDWLEQGPALSLGWVVHIGKQVARGLWAAHQRNVIHRDIKPANVFLVGGSSELGETVSAPGPSSPPPVKLLDFGLARPLQDTSNLTATGYVVGTPYYMAPEQAQGDPLDTRCDLFSLGCVLYQMCTQRKPFDGSDTLAILSSLVRDEPPDLSQINPQAPPSLCQLVRQLMAKDREKRPGSSSVVVDTLSAIEREMEERATERAGS